MSSDYELLQRFVPELEQLRIEEEDEDDTGSLQIEVLATFEWEEGHAPSETFGVSVLNGTQLIGVNCSGTFEESPCMGFAGDSAMGPILPVETNSVTVHIIVDHQIIESIFNNRTANGKIQQLACSSHLISFFLEINIGRNWSAQLFS